MSEALDFFDPYFCKISSVGGASVTPYPWQRALFTQLIDGDWPDSVALPTGAGKTSILKVWLLSLAWSVRAGRHNVIPRRLAWVVNRRVVVDQATTEAKLLADNLKILVAKGDEYACALRDCSFEKSLPLAVSTLRGQKADNREWSQDPLVPAIIVGTVDMIGSRLLFRGYGDGKYFRPYHAGLLGVDTLIVNDESHLTPAFARLLQQVADLKPAEQVKKTFRVMRVSATAGSGGRRPFLHDVTVDESESPRFANVFRAAKRLQLHEAADKADAAKKMLQLAVAPGADRTIIFVEEPEEAAKFRERLEKEVGTDGKVVLLAGTIRGYERDRLSSEDGGLAVFLQRQRPASGRHFLVTTSAGEVGIDMSGERMVTMLRESESLLQRFGRLNRFGDQEGEPPREGRAEVVYVPPKAKRGQDDGKADAKDAILAYLLVLTEGGRIAADISCKAFWQAPPPPETMSPEPLCALLETRLIDLWSQTSSTGTGDAPLPPVESWLHGKQDNYPETEVAWRAEVDLLASEAVSDRDREKALKLYRVLPQETLHEPTSRLRKKLGQLPDQQRRVLFRDRDSNIKSLPLCELLDEKEFADRDLADGLVLLPEGFGWLAEGMFRATPVEGAQPANDVADEDNDEAQERRRYLLEQSEDGFWRRTRLGDKTAELERELVKWDQGLDAGGRRLRIGLEPVGGRDAVVSRFLLLEAGVKERGAGIEVPLQDHLDHVAELARKIADCALGDLKLRRPARDIFGEAGEWHDRGKDCERWQVAMGGSKEHPLAKTKKALRPSDLEGYRHELGSLLEIRGKVTEDLVLHEIASHHGWARPYWEKKAYLPEAIGQSHAAGLEAIRRFDVLQSEFGAWGLSYLEALFKAADAAASRRESESEK
jgi:CRISPR-associated endonuclease/helicase Cas3